MARQRSQGPKQQYQNTQQSAGFRAAYSQQARKGMPYSTSNVYPGKSVPGSVPTISAGQYSRMNPAYSTQSIKKQSKGKKIAIGFLISLIVVVLGVGTAAGLYIKNVNAELNQGNLSEEEQLAIVDALSPSSPTSFDDSFYMMLLGSDSREDGSVAGSRADTSMVVRVDPVNSVVTMISIPRDTKINIPGYGFNKFNAAYSYGGAAGAIEAAEDLLGIEITHYAEVDFGSLADLVDAVGGVDIYVEEPISDPNLPGVYIEAGDQHLDGENALAYARTRQYADGDFTRTAHQRALVMAIVEEVLAMPLTDLPKVISSAASCVTTDFSVEDLIALAKQFQGKFDEMTFYSTMVPSTTGMEGGISYVYADTYALTEFMQLVEAGDDPNKVQTAGATGSSSEAFNSTHDITDYSEESTTDGTSAVDAGAEYSSTGTNVGTDTTYSSGTY